MATEPTAEIVAAEDNSLLVQVDLTPENETPPSEVVAVAEIEANRDITIAAIHADTEQAHIEAQAERAEEWHENNGSIQAQLAALQSTVETQAETIANLLALSMPPIVAEDLTPLAEAETIATLETPPETSVTIKTEAPENVEVKTEPEPAPKRGRAYMI